MKKLHGRRWGVTALLLGAAAGGACGGQASGEYDDGAGAMTGVGPGGMAGLGGAARGGSGGRGGRGGQGGTAMAGASGRGGSGTGGRGAGGSVSIGGNAGVAGASMGGAAGTDVLGSCSAPAALFGPVPYFYSARIERSSENAFDVCAGNGPQHVMRWTPPTSGRYLIDTFGSAFDTVLYASSDLSCSPSAPNPQLHCNDDFRPNSIQSLLGVQAVAGRDMLVVVDSYISAGGDFNLMIRGESECPRIDLGEQLGLALYSTFDFTQEAVVLPPATLNGCRGGELGMSLVWRAPASGVYRFASGSGFPTAIALLDSCEGDVLECDSAGDVNNISEVTRSLSQGQEIVIEVTVLQPLPQIPWGPLQVSVEPL